MRFNIGDVIKVKEPVGCKDLKNQIGTIVSVDEICECYAVEFENDIGGHDCDCGIKDGYGWWVDDSWGLELVSKYSFKIGDRVKVIDSGKNYGSYSNWVDKYVTNPKLRRKWHKNHSPSEFDTYCIKYIGEHENGYNTIAYIQNEANECCYMVEIHGLELVEEKKVFTKEDLKNGDVILRRNGEVEIVILETGTCVSTTGFMRVSAINEDLTHGVGDWDDNEWDIVAVRRPKSDYQCSFDAFESELGELVYDRERDTVKEMTIGEIEEQLGYKIKVVKE